MTPHALGAVGLAALAWLVASPTESATKQDDAIFAICRAESRVATTGSVPTVSIESGMGDGGFPIATATKPAQACSITA
jgi:hypothetical protein